MESFSKKKTGFPKSWLSALEVTKVELSVEHLREGNLLNEYNASYKAEQAYPKVEALKITGNADMNSADWYALSLRNIEKLDLSELKIASIDYDQWNIIRCFDDLILPESLEYLGIQPAGPDESVPNDHRYPTILHNYDLHNYNLQILTLPEGLKYINPAALSRLSSLQEIRVSPRNERYTSVDGVLFEKRNGLPVKLVAYSYAGDEVYELPPTVIGIGEYAFAGTLIKKIGGTERLREIGECAFLSCDQLKALGDIRELRVIGNSAFCRSSLDKIVLPDTIETIGMDAFKWSSLKEMIIPEGLTAITARSFMGIYRLESITLPDSITEIGEAAFAGCAMREVNLPKYLREVGENAFVGCFNLERVIFTSGLPPVIKLNALRTDFNVHHDYTGKYHLLDYGGNERKLKIYYPSAWEALPDNFPDDATPYDTVEKD